jgi:type IV secretory pathway VirD2 relaxase
MPKSPDRNPFSSPSGGRRDSPVDTLTESPVFRVRLGTANAGHAPKIKGFIGRIKALVRQQSGMGKGRHRSTAGAGGSAAARLAVRSSPQRVIVKARIVKHGKYAGSAGGAARMLAKHVDYLGRGSAAEDRKRGVVFNGDEDLDPEQLRALRQEMVGDRHHFRFIVSPEAGSRLDLKAFARELVGEMQTDLGTPLTWIGVAHYDTDEPHIHLLVCGKNAAGADLVINRNYISHGMRLQAGEVATRHLGPRLAEDIARSLKRDLKAGRVTGIDLSLEAQAARHPDGLVSALRRPDGSLAHEQQRLNTLSRLQHLESLGLAREITPGVWQPDRELVPRLRALGMRGDIIKRMHERLKGLDPGSVPLATDRVPDAPVIGRVAARGTADELSDAEYLVVEARDGRAYYVPVREASGESAAPIPVGALVQLSPPARDAASPLDRHIAARAAATRGVFDSTSIALAGAAEGGPGDTASPDPSSESLSQRARVLSRRGFLEDLGGDRFRVPADLEARIAAATRGRQRGIDVELISRADLSTQATVNGITWLDREIARGVPIAPTLSVGATRFQRDLARAFKDRAEHLQRVGLGEKADGGFRARGRLLDELYARELQDAARRLQGRFGEQIALPESGNLKGRIAAIEELPSGAHAVLAMSGGYALVPANGALAKQVGRDLKLTLSRGRHFDPMEEGVKKIAIRFQALELNRTRKRGR